MKTSPKRILSMLLALMMLLTLLPTAALAAEVLPSVSAEIAAPVVGATPGYSATPGNSAEYTIESARWWKGVSAFESATTLSAAIPLTFEDKAVYDIPAGEVGTTYTSTTAFTATGGKAPYEFAVALAVNGLSINSDNRLVYTRPFARAADTTIIMVIDDLDNTQTITINIGEVTPIPMYTVPTATKTLIDDDPIPNGFSSTFTAKIEAVSTTVPGMAVSAIPMPENSTVSTEAFTAADTKNFAAFGTIAFATAGEYVYRITETAGSTAGVTYDKSEYELTVRVFEGQNGQLETFETISQTKDSDGTQLQQPETPNGLVFANTYTAGPTYTVPAPKKELAGTIPAGFSATFSAKIEAVSHSAPATPVPINPISVGSMPMPTSATATTEAFTAAGEKNFASFGDITFTTAGTYVYKITETAGSTAGMTYDKSEYQLTVNVRDGQNGPAVSSVDLVQTKAMDGTSYPQVVHPNIYRFYNTYTKPNDPGSNVTRYTLTFDSNGGSNINSITGTSGITIDLSPYVPTREGYTFNGWYADKSITEKVTSVKLTKDMTAYAGWSFNGALNADDHVAFVIGYPDGTVGPDRNITRAETAMMLYRLLTPERRAEITVATSSFPDVDINTWYGVAASSMAKGGYIVGYNDGTFGGKRQITRAEFVTMLVRFISKAEGSKSFSDVPTTYWAYEFISTASAAGWIDGYTDGTFGPKKPITRAEAMTIVNRVLNRGVDADSELLDFKVWPDNKKGVWYYYDIIEATNAHEYTGARPSEDWTTILK